VGLVVLETIKKYKVLIGIIAFMQASAIPFAIWAADTVFHTDKEAVVKQIQMIEYDIQELQVDYGFSETDRERKKYETKIKIKESQIRQLEEEL